jgi:hypothetical protein
MLNGGLLSQGKGAKACSNDKLYWLPYDLAGKRRDAALKAEMREKAKHLDEDECKSGGCIPL